MPVCIEPVLKLQFISFISSFFRRETVFSLISALPRHTYPTALSVAIFVLKLTRAIRIGQNVLRPFLYCSSSFTRYKDGLQNQLLGLLSPPGGQECGASRRRLQ